LLSVLLANSWLFYVILDFYYKLEKKHDKSWCYANTEKKRNSIRKRLEEKGATILAGHLHQQKW
jgi:hypothetical protein